MTRLDRPWHRPGAAKYALRRLHWGPKHQARLLLPIIPRAETAHPIPQ